MTATVSASTELLSSRERHAIAQLRQGYQLVPPGATVIGIGPPQHGPQREAWLKDAVAECAYLMETFSDEIHADYNRRPDRQNIWSCPACAQVARVRRAPVAVVNPYGVHPDQRAQQSP